MSSMQNDEEIDDAVDGSDLTHFQLATLAVLSDGDDYGLAIKRELDDYYGKSVNHGRLYPNLDTLVKQGLATKTPLDKRTNEYGITRRGERLLDEWFGWFDARINGGDSE